jgi:hypothetical protein
MRHVEAWSTMMALVMLMGMLMLSFLNAWMMNAHNFRGGPHQKHGGSTTCLGRALRSSEERFEKQQPGSRRDKSLFAQREPWRQRPHSS